METCFHSRPSGRLGEKPESAFWTECKWFGDVLLRQASKPITVVGAGGNKDVYNLGWQMGAGWECCILGSDMRKAKRGLP